MSDRAPGQPLRVALFRNVDISHPYTTINDDVFEQIGGYARVSDYVEITFAPLSDTTQIEQIVTALDRTRESTVREFTRKLADIDRQKAELLAITHQPTSPPDPWCNEHSASHAYGSPACDLQRDRERRT